jgi:hypothetical protein
MKKIIKIKLPNEQEIIWTAFENSDPDETFEEGVRQTGSLKDRLQKTVKTVATGIATEAIEIIVLTADKISDIIVSFSNGIFKKFDESSDTYSPKKVEIEYSIEITPEADIKIATISSSGSIKVTATWEKKP